jgi:hypothetical protein
MSTGHVLHWLRAGAQNPVGAASPCVAQKRPAGQGMQAAAEVAARLGLYVAIGHAVGDVAPTPHQLPAGHASPKTAFMGAARKEEL